MRPGLAAVSILLVVGCGAVPEARDRNVRWLEPTELGYEQQQIEAARVYIRANLSPEAKRALLLHEMGHVLRGEPGHIDDPAACPPGQRGAFVMCLIVPYDREPAPEDLAFVLPER